VNRHEHIAEAETCITRAAEAGNEAKATFWHREGLIHAVLAVALSHPDKRSFVPHKQQRRSA
jgi:hypothetical protein